MALDSDPGIGVGTILGAPAASSLAMSYCLNLSQYAEIIGYNRYRFWGITEDPSNSLQPLWTHAERDFAADYLSSALSAFEEEIGYPVCARWITNDERPYSIPLLAGHTHIIEAGVRASEDISTDEAVSYLTEPATVGPVATTVTDEDEIYLMHPGTNSPIYPSSITLDTVAGTVEFEIPRYELLTETGQQNDDGIPYSETGAGAGYFEQTVDVVRVYNDPSTQAVFRWPTGSGACPSCSGTTATGCITIGNATIGEMMVYRASYSAGTWTRTTSRLCSCSVPRVQLNYKAGLTTLPKAVRAAIIRLAHAQMPHDPCNVEPPLYMWVRDREIPRVLTKERLNCPWGLENGAWVAYRKAVGMKVLRGGIF